MKKAFIFLTTGFEDAEAVGTIDVLRRGGVDLKTVSLTGSLTVIAKHGIPMMADLLFADAPLKGADLLVIPGGTEAFNQHEPMKAAIVEQAAAGGKVAAICAAPMVLGGLGLLKGRRATCYPGYEKYLEGATVVSDPAVVDGNFITGRGPGRVFDFALAVLGEVESPAKADEVARQMTLK